MDGAFKVPALPSSTNGSKRKLQSSSTSPPPDSSASKRARVSSSSSSSANGKPVQQFGYSIPLKVGGQGSSEKGKGKAATVEDEVENEDVDMTGPMDVAEDEEYGVDAGDEEGGRFFGGGINETQEKILDMFANVEDEQPAGLPTIQELRRQIIKFERIVNKNADMRSKYADEPRKYLESEDDLDKSFTFLYPLPQNPLLFYPELIKHETLLTALTNLLSHENTDISLQVISALYEMTDEDVGEDLVEGEEEEERKEEVGRDLRMVMGELVDALLDKSILELLVSNLNRLNETTEETDRTGVFNILGVFENLLTFLPPLANQIIETTGLMPWLLTRLGVEEYDSNKQYASEILSILLQEEREVRLKLGELKGVEVLLKAIDKYRNKDPGDSEEVEYMENLFNTLCSALNEPEIKQEFINEEGMELMALIMKEKVLARTRALKVVDYATQTEEGKMGCEVFVEAAGLKSLFAMFMGKGGAKKGKMTHAFATPPLEDEEHVVSILASLFTSLDSDTPARIRTLAKFVENEYEKVDRLLELREAAEMRLGRVDREVAVERQIMEQEGEEITEEETDDWYLRRMNAGLAHLQNIDYVLAWVLMEDDGAQGHARMLLARKDRSFNDVAAVLKELRDVMADDVDRPTGEDAGIDKVAILEALIGFCEAL